MLKIYKCEDCQKDNPCIVIIGYPPDVSVKPEFCPFSKGHNPPHFNEI